MKRDMNLCREILLALEPLGFREEVDITYMMERIDGYTIEEVGYHAFILGDGGYIFANELSHHAHTPIVIKTRGLTWKGHEILDAIRDEGFFNNLLEHMKSMGIPVLVENLPKLIMMYYQQNNGG